MEYSVVEFTDGVNLVPTIWLTADHRKCHWPLIENKMIYSKMVSSQVMPRPNDPSWGIYSVKKVLCKTNTYQEGIYKLKKAEKYSEVESSASDADPKAKRAKRQLRAKKILFDDLSDSDSNNSVTSNPKYDDIENTTINSLKNQSTFEDQTQHNVHEDSTASAEFPQFPVDKIVETMNFATKSMTTKDQTEIIKQKSSEKVLVRFTKADLTNKMYGEIVAKWLVQAPQRFKREEAKKEKARRILQLNEDVGDQN
eukprot:XP_003245765.1 PREDICTED: uncharacterized protein LOC100569124 [Acyrthosiphon pisum]